jgi:hypothetical protein
MVNVGLIVGLKNDGGDLSEVENSTETNDARQYYYVLEMCRVVHAT